MAVFFAVACEGTSQILGEVSFHAAMESVECEGQSVDIDFKGGESLAVTADGENYFTFANTEAEPSLFLCATEGVESLVSGKVTIRNAQAVGAVNSALGVDGTELYAVASLADGNVTLEVVSAFIRFSSEYYLTLEGNGLFGDGQTPVSEVTVAAGTDVIIPINAGAVELSYTIGSNRYECAPFEAAAATLYDLGTLAPTDNPSQKPDEPAGESSVVYLVPNSDWMNDGAWFAAHFFNDADGYADIKLTDDNGDKIYECAVPQGMNKMLFCRMNPAATEFGWESVWNQTADTEVGVAPYNYYYIVDWAAGEWHEAGYTVPEKPQQSSAFALAGTFNSWGDLPMTDNNGIHSAKGVTLEAYAELKVKAATTWDISFGGGIAYLNPNNYMKVFENGSNIAITEAGTYDIYFDHANLNLYVVTAGADYTSVPLQEVNGKEPVQQEPEGTSVVLYFTPNSSWKEADARFAAYFWNASGSNAWASMTDSNADGIYELNIPVGYTLGDNIIFCRMNPSTTANTWSNKWNQTSDLVIPTDGKNHYTLPEGIWDGGDNTTWSTK